MSNYDASAITGDVDDTFRNKPVPPDLEGYLSKLKHKSSLFGSWTKRYFIVNPTTECVEYYKTKSSAFNGTAPSGSLSLGNLTAIRKFDGNSFQLIAGAEVLFLLADSAAEQACWIRGLEAYILERQVTTNTDFTFSS